MGPDITFKCTKISSACTVPGCWEHAEIPVCTLQLGGISARQDWISPSWYWTPADQQPVLWKAFITNLPCLKDLDADNMRCWALNYHTIQWFEHSHLQNSGCTQHQRLSLTDSSCKPCRLAWLCLRRLHAEVKNCRPSKYNDPYLQNKTGLTSSPTHRKEKHFKWTAKSCQDTSICCFGLSLFSLLSFMTESGRMRRWQQHIAEVTSTKGQSWL